MSRKNILIIDDEVNFAKLVKMNIEAATNYECVTARSGEEGLGLAQDRPFDLVLLDIMMPGLTGFEVLKRIKAIRPTLPVVMVTAVWKEREAKQCFVAGACGYVTKPIDFGSLHAVLVDKLEEASAQAVSPKREPGGTG